MSESILTKFLEIYSSSGLRGSYRLTKFLSHRLKSLQCIRIQTESGVLYADLRIPSSRGILANPKSQSGEDAVMRKLVNKGDIVFDIGAHLGLYTLLLSELVGEKGKVFSFEPNPELLPMLKMTVKSLPNVELNSIALSDKAGKVNLFVPEDPTMASLSNWTDGTAGNVHRVSCEMQRMDDLVESGKLPLPDFIKCDVEGAELSIFRGGIETLNRAAAPFILFEVNAKAAKAFGKTTTDYFNFLKSFDDAKYTFFEVLADGVRELKPKEIQYTNVVAVPEQKRDSFCNKLYSGGL